MGKDDTLLTMGMAVYNEEKHIGEAIESLLAQTYKDFILLISDNGSTDRTPEICKHYAEKDKRIIFVGHDKNRGSLFNLKYVLSGVSTPFFMCCGGHDKWHPQFVEKLLPLVQNEDLVLVYPESQEIKFDGSLGKIYEENYTTSSMQKPAERYLYMLKNIRACNLFQGIWKTQALKNCYLKPVISNDILILLHASLMGKFKQHKSVLFFRRINREEKKGDDMYQRQIGTITGEYPKKSISTNFLKNQFIFENLKMIHKANQLSLISKLGLSTQTTYVWIKKFYIRIPLSLSLRRSK